MAQWAALAWEQRWRTMRSSAAGLPSFSLTGSRSTLPAFLFFPATHTEPPAGVLAGGLAAQAARGPTACAAKLDVFILPLRPASRAFLRGDDRSAILRVVGGGVSAGARKGRAQHVIGEEIPAVDGHHHDLQFVRKPLGDNFLNQHGVLLQHGSLELH